MPAIPGYRHLAQDETHRGGRPRVADAGVSVHTVWSLYESGFTPRQIADEYEGLTLGGVMSALAYAADFPEEMERYLHDDQAATAAGRLTSCSPASLEAAHERSQVLS